MAAIGATSLVIAAIATPLITALVEEPDIACTGEIESVIAIVVEHPEAWVPLRSDDPYQMACNLNEVAKRVGAAARTPTPAPTNTP